MIDLEAEFCEVETDSYDGFLHRTLNQAEDIAKSKGLVLRSPAPNELFIDIDSDAALREHARLMKAAPKGLVTSSYITPSPSGKSGHFHVVVTLSREVSSTERVMLQALFGSDLMRELLSWRRIQDGAEDNAVSLFFEKPGPS